MAIHLVEPDEFDLIVVGSGLPEVLIASSAAKAGKSVLIIDAVDTYGTDYASFTLASLQHRAGHTHASDSSNLAESERAQAPRVPPIHPLPESWLSHSIPEQQLPVHSVQMFTQAPDPAGSTHSSSCCISNDESRRFILDLAPKMLYQAEALVELMVRSRAHHYVEFKLVEASYILQRGVLASVPASKSDIFRDKRLSLGDKRLLMKFINSMMSPDANAPPTQSQPVQGWLPQSLVTEQQGRESLQLFMDSMARFSPGSAFMVPSYGCGSLPEAFVRQAAVFGAVTVLRQPVQALVTNPAAGGECCAVVTNSGQLIKCKALVTAAAVAQALLPASSPPLPAIITHRALLILGGSLAAGQSNLTLVIPPHSPGLDNPHAIRGLQMGPNTCTTPAGRYILYLSTPAHSSGSHHSSPYHALWKAAAVLTRTESLASDANAESFGCSASTEPHPTPEQPTGPASGHAGKQQDTGMNSKVPVTAPASDGRGSSSKAAGADTAGDSKRPLALQAYFYDQHSHEEDPASRPFPPPPGSAAVPGGGGGGSSRSHAASEPRMEAAADVDTASREAERPVPMMPSNVGSCCGPDLGLAGYRRVVEQAERLCARLLPGVAWLPAHTKEAGASDGRGEAEQSGDEEDSDAITALQDAMLGLKQQPLAEQPGVVGGAPPEEHYADELEEELDSALENDFNVEAEDDSPHEVAKSLVKIYGECLAGDFTSVDKMISAAAASGAQQSQRQVLDRDGTEMEGDDSGSSSGGEDDSDDEEMDTDNGHSAPQGAPLAQQQAAAAAAAAPVEPVVDADGFTLVAPGRRKGKR
ncbi:MAG: hypothetical protein WDW36_005978 [Sanguina aurantia]